MEPPPPTTHHLHHPYDLPNLYHNHHPPPYGAEPMAYPPPHPPPHHYDLSYLPPAPAPSYFSPEQQTICTLFVAGLPDDVKAREIYNLFRLRRGFESCQLEYTGRGNQVVAFATFSDHRSAVAAMTDLNGAIFDPQIGSKLFVELARSNSRTKRALDGRGYTIIDKRAKVVKDDQKVSCSDGDDGSDELDSDNDKSSNKASLLTKKSDNTPAKSDHVQDTGKEKSESEKQVGEIPPCSTLFIVNLGPNCTKDELKEVLSQYSGFQSLKMRGRSGKPVAFADFKDVKCSTEALNSLQGKVLDKSDHAMHVEYARSKMRNA